MKPHFDWLDYTRFVSALCVVCFHYMFNGVDSMGFKEYVWLDDITKYGYLGVNFFFVVSGFVIAFSVQDRKPGPFVVSRFLRLWPAFFLCMSLTALVRLLSNDEFFNSITVQQYLANLTIFPRAFGEQRMDGVYWTLEYEIWFYLAVAGLIFLRVPLSRALVPWLLLIIAFKFTRFETLPLVGVHYVWFIVGCMAFTISRDGGSPARYFFITIATALALYEVCGKADALSLRRETYYSPWVIGTVCGAFLSFFFAMSWSRLSRISLPLARPLGLITYPLYLLHSNIGFVLLSEFGREEMKLVQTLAVTVFMILLSVLVVYGWEKPTRPLFGKFAEMVLGRPLAALDDGIGLRIRNVFARYSVLWVPRKQDLN